MLTSAKWCAKVTAVLLALAIILSPVSSLLPRTAGAACPTTLSVAITDHPYLLVDSNFPGVQGPLVTMVRAAITNTGAIGANDIYIHVGNGIVPGTFPVGSDGQRLGMLDGADPTRYIAYLGPGQSLSVYWMLVYPYTFGQTYPLTVWAENADGCSAQDSHTYTTRSALSASANKMLGTVTVDPPGGIVHPGNLLTITNTAFNFGQVGSGPNNEEDVWMQPVGNLDFDPTCFRLVRTEVYIHSISSVPPYGPMPYIDRLYFSGVKSQNPPPNYSYNPADYVKYTFIALGTCTTTAKIYQEAASGNVEKYSGQYGDAGATITVTSQSGGIDLAKSVLPKTAVANTLLTWTITYTNNTDYPVGDPATGNGLVVVDEAIPPNTTYVAGSATCSGSCIVFFSTDNGVTWTRTEPLPAQVTKIKWYIDEAVPAHSSGTVSFQSRVNAGVPGSPLICNSASAYIGGGASIASDTACANAGVDLELEKVVDDGTACENDSVTYTVTVTNKGTSGATGIQVTDQLPGGVSYQSHVASQGGYNSGTGLWTVGNLAATGSATLDIAATVDAGTGGSTIVNIGNITHSDQVDPNLNDNWAQADITVHVPPAVTASSSSPVCEGGTIYLYGGPDGMSSYHWTGPGGYDSDEQNPSRSGATMAMAGLYSLTVTDEYGCTNSADTSVVINVCGTQPPDQPTNESPGDGACILIPVTLTGSASSDPDIGDIHVASQWQIRTSTGSYTSPVFDSGRDTGNLTSITIPLGILTPSTSYCWHVRYQDNNGAWSPYSAETCFCTGNTMVGMDVTVVINGTSVTFGQVNTGGCTCVTTTGANPGGPLPADCCLVGVFVDVTTTAAYVGPVTVELSYSELGRCVNPDPRLLHWDGANWVDVTTYVDAGGGIIRGQVANLSPFFISCCFGVGGGGVPVFPSVYIGMAAAFGSGIVAYFLRRRLLAHT